MDGYRSGTRQLPGFDYDYTLFFIPVDEDKGVDGWGVWGFEDVLVYVVVKRLGDLGTWLD